MTPPPVLRGHDFVCFSSIDWQFLWQGHQEIMSTLVANGNRVLFVENTGVRAPSIKDLPRVRQRIRNWWRGTKGFREERSGLFIYSPLLLPFPYSPIVRWLNRHLLERALRRWMKAARFGRPIVWTFLPTPLVRAVVPALEPLATIYYCIDDFASSSAAARRITESEERMFRDVDLVFVTSEKLRQRAAAFSHRVHLFPFGVSFRKFEEVRLAADQVPGDLAALGRPVIGYVGGIHRWVDVELLVAAAQRMPAASFVLIGPLQIDDNPADRAPNVHVLGKRPHEDVPRYIKGFDVGIVPYVLSEYTSNVYPTKLNEYLAMGIPVVATDLPEIRRFNLEHGAEVAVAGDANQFVAALTQALGPSTEPERHRRIDIARENSWESRLGQMSGLIARAVEANRNATGPWEATLRRVYRRARGLAASIALLIVAYGLVFHTSLLWAAAEPLRLAAAPVPADAIVVFAGGMGESGRAGGGYQERVKSAVDLYQEGLAPRVIFVSGFVFAFREAEIMRDLALSLGIPPAAIVLETDAANTYEAVTSVRDRLRDQQWRRILLVSSPYHMRRASLVWAKQAPEVDVIPAPVARTQFYAHGRGANGEQVRGILQEYLAIAYYRYKGWI